MAKGILGMAHEHGFLLAAEYIGTHVNPADAVSRQREPDMRLVEDVMNDAWGRKEVWNLGDTCVWVEGGSVRAAPTNHCASHRARNP